MNESPSVAVLGAGMAGAAAAHRLARAGIAVRVFDKGRGVGGRMATRRIETPNLRFDHGAQFLSANGPAFAAQVADWCRRGVAAPWGTDGRVVGVPGMTAPVRDLLDGLPVSLATTVSGIRREAAGWHVADAAGAGAGPFDALAVTVPAPQLEALLDAGGIALPGPERAVYAPCWSLMVALDHAPGFPDALYEPAGGPIGLLAREATKPGRAPGNALVVHAAPDWSRAHLEEPHEAVEAALLSALSDILGRHIRPAYAGAHRWRYAAVETALGEDCLYDPALRLGAGGDWCLGPRIEAAYESGSALVGRILADLGMAG